jgi:ATP-dependent Clp protease ATP-binding subunit ClpC
MSGGRRQLRVDTQVLRRELWSGNVTVAPAAEARLICHGDEDAALGELRVLLSEVLAEARPVRISRHLLPAGTALHTVRVQVVRRLGPTRLREPLPIAFTCVSVPQGRDRWVLVPALGHTFYLARGEDLDVVAASEIARVLRAMDPEGASLPSLLPAAATTLVPLDAFVVADAAAAHASRRAAVEAERRRQAEEALDDAGERLHARLARRGGVSVVGRDRALAELDALLGGGDRLSVLIVGDEAVGKTALVDAWAARHPRRAAWVTSTAQLVAGASGLGEWQERVARVMNAAELLDAVLYIDDFGALFADKPEEGGVDVASAIRRFVSGGRVRVLGEITPVAVERAERRDVALLGAMNRLRVEPLDPAATVAVLRARAAQWARGEPHRPTVAEAALAPVVELCRRYLPYRAFPGKAVRFLEELRATRETERDPSGKPTALGLEDSYEAFSLVTGIPAFLLRDDRELHLGEVVGRLRRRMIGQDEAVRRVAETICVAKAQLGPADKPLATFLFVGPTGVGKTELARSLADFLFGSEARLVRFDMSEYGDPWAAQRLIAGRGGDAGDGLLTSKVREQPFCVILLDEIEKAHPAVFDLLLQVLGEGRLTDGRGRTTYFQNAIIVMTSNLGAVGARGALGIAPAGDPADRDRQAELDRYRAAVAAAFRPELVNRIDRVIAFHRLDAAEVAAVARLQVAKASTRRGLAGAGIALELTPAALDVLAAGGYSAQWGVRALRRHLDDALIAPLARLLGHLGGDAKGALVHVRTAAEPLPAELPVGGQLARDERGAVAISVHRRSRASSRRAAAGVIAVADVRRAADRAMRHPIVTGIADHLGWLRGQLIAAAAQRKGAKQALSSQQLQQMQTELARLDASWRAADDVRGEIRAAEELAMAALMAGDDAQELVASIDDTLAQFHRRYFHLLTARVVGRDQVTLIAHGVDHHAGLERWLLGLFDDVGRRGWRCQVHLRSSLGVAGTWPETRSWGHPRTPEQVRGVIVARHSPIRSALLRVEGGGAGVLLGCERGTHRWHRLAAVDPCHVVIDRVALRTEFTDGQWLSAALAAAWPTQAPRGDAEREHDDDRAVWIGGRDHRLDIPWRDYFARLEEIALADVVAHLATDGAELDDFYAASLDTSLDEASP